MKFETVVISSEDAEILSLLKENETSLADFINSKEEYIADLEYKLDQLQEAAQTMNVLRQDMQDILNTAFRAEAITLADIKKAIDRRQA